MANMPSGHHHKKNNLHLNLFIFPLFAFDVRSQHAISKLWWYVCRPIEATTNHENAIRHQLTDIALMSSSSTRLWLKLRISDIVKKSHSANYHGYNDTHRFAFVANVVINLNERFQKESMNHFNICVIDVFKIKYSFISCLLHIKLNQINQNLTLFLLTGSYIHV